MEIWEVALLFVAGCVAGFTNVMAGGGSLLTMPIMVFMGLPGPAANGTNRVAILIQSISSTVAFFQRGLSDFRLSLTLTLCAMPGAIAGAFLGTKLEGVWFNRVLAGVMIAVMILMWRKKKGKTESEETKTPPSARRTLFAHLLMFGAGVYGGFIQAGVGFILMAILYRVLGLDLVRVNMHKVFIVGTYTIVALAVFAINGHVEWTIGLLLAIGNATGAWVGTHYTVKKGERLIRIVLNTALLIMAIKLAVG